MPDQMLGSMLRINRYRIRALRAALAPYNYIGTMHLVLHYVNLHPGANQEEIGCFYALDKTNVAREAKKLEDMGHIRREIDTENRRQYKLYITPEGEKMLSVIDGVYEDFRKRMSCGMSEEDWKALTALLKRVEQNSSV